MKLGKTRVVTPEPIDSRTHRVLSGVSRVAVLELLRSAGAPLDVQAISEQVGLHTNTVRSHLDQLVEAGLVVRAVQSRSTPGRPRVVFHATATPRPGTEDSYQLLAEILASGIRDGEPAPGAVAAEAGRRWGQNVEEKAGARKERVDAAHAIDRLVTVLDEIGFEPTIGAPPPTETDPRVGDGATVIELHRCPFYDVARDHTDVVCAVHLGLIQGALDQMQAPPSAIRLEPFVRPDLCLVHISPATPVRDRHAALA
jgi:predicted ArsR family transcriptional regulator